ncbi:DNA-directed RNA polymerase [Caldiplasma sukawensis]
MIVEDEYIVRVDPTLLNEDYDLAVEKVAHETIQGKIVDQIENDNLSEIKKIFIVSILKVERIDDGTIVHGDGGVYQKIKYTALGYYPRIGEIVDGIITNIIKIGAFVKFGPFEGFLHVSQIMDDRIDIDEQSRVVTGKETKNTLKVGDVIRVRIVMLNIASSSPSDRRIGLTSKQLGLGKIDVKKTEGFEIQKEETKRKTTPKKRSDKKESSQEFVSTEEHPEEMDDDEENQNPYEDVTDEEA